MKKHVGILGLMMAAGICAAALLPLSGCPTLSGRADDLFSETYAFNAGGLIDIEHEVGRITIQGHDADQIIVEALRVVQVAGNRDDADAQRFLEDVEVIVTPGETIFRIETDISDGIQIFGVQPRVDLTLTVPETILIEISSGVAETMVSDIDGRLEIEQGTGSIELFNVRGDIEVASGTGSIELIHPTELESTERIQADTGTGDIEVALPTGSGFTINASTGTGDIDGGGFGFSGNIFQDVDNAVVNGGGAIIDVSTGTGNIDFDMLGEPLPNEGEAEEGEAEEGETEEGETEEGEAEEGEAQEGEAEEGEAEEGEAEEGEAEEGEAEEGEAEEGEAQIQ